MIDILSQIDPNELYHAIGPTKSEALTKLVCENPNEEPLESLTLAKYIYSIYGADLLYNRKLRHLVFTLIDQSRLKELAEKYGKKSYEKSYDNALVLSIYPWRANSNFVAEVAKELSIPKEFLPSTIRKNAAVETIEPVDFLFDLHDYQKELKDLIIEELDKRTKRFLVQMPTGAGKTRTIIEALFDYSCKTNLFLNEGSILWLAHTEELCEQAIDTFKDVWQNLGDSPAQIVRCWGNYSPRWFDVSGSFVVGTYQKSYSLMTKADDIFSTLKGLAKIIVIDEAHKAIAPSYSKVINALCSNNENTLIGLTATPGRGRNKTEENIALSRFFDKKLITPTFTEHPITELRKKGILARIERQVIATGIDVKLRIEDFREIDKYFDLPRNIIKILAENVKRNRIILRILSDEIKKGNPCLVFSCSVEHSRLLSAALSFQGYASAWIDCYTRKSSRKKIVEGFRKGEYLVLFNYGVLSTGFDAPLVKTIVITRPTASIVLYSQMIGRGLRGPAMGGSEGCNLVDLIDNYVNFGGVKEVYTFFEEYWN